MKWLLAAAEQGLTPLWRFLAAARGLAG